MAVDGPDVAPQVDHVAMKKKYPGTHLYRGPFPKGYFKKVKPPDPATLNLKKLLARRGLPESWSSRILRLNLGPTALLKLLRRLADLNDNLKSIEAEIKSLLTRKPTIHESIIPDPITTDPGTTGPDSPPDIFDSSGSEKVVVLPV
jgi:hypothetical protein